MENGDGAIRFGRDLDQRAARTQALMRRHGLRGLIVYSDAAHAGNVRYLTNYTPLFGPAALLVRDDSECTLVITFNWDAPRARLSGAVEQIDSGFDTGGLVAQALTDLGLRPDDRIGLVGGDVIPHAVYQAITRDAGRPDPVDVHHEFLDLRLIKSPLEQDMLRQAAAATDAGLDAMLAEAHAGMTELELAAVVEYHMKRAGADGFSFPASVASGPNTEKPVSLPSHRRLELGDLVMIDIGATWEGYNADMTRTVVVGTPSNRQVEVHAIAISALDAAIEAVRPGVPANTLHRAAVDVLTQHGLDQYFTHRVGHGIGLETSLEPPDLQRNDWPLRPGMTFCVEPGIYIPWFGGVKIEDDVIVGSEGAEIISHAPRELQIIS